MRRYLTLFIIGFLSIAAAISGVNYVVNPYDYWDVPRVDGFNRVMPEFGRQQMRAKPRQWQRLAPEIVILGNSRVQVGFDPDASRFEGKKVYNAGFPGVALSGQVKVLKAIEEKAKPKVIYVALEFLDFRISEQAWREGKLDQLSPSTMTLRGYAELLWSITAFTDSVKTLAVQPQTYPANVTAKGYNPALDFQAFVNAQGHAPLFKAKEQEYIQNAVEKPKKISWERPGSSIEWRALDELIQWAAVNDVELVFFSHPYHISFLNMLDQTGLWPAFEQWKMSVLERAKAHDIAFWDFTVVASETTEAVKRKGQMAYYWEAGHYKAAMGEAIMEQMQGHEGFGVLLNETDIETHLISERLVLKSYNDAHPEDARRIRDRVDHLSLRKSTSELATK